jgi:hypothetical protein
MSRLNTVSDSEEGGSGSGVKETPLDTPDRASVGGYPFDESARSAHLPSLETHNHPTTSREPSAHRHSSSHGHAQSNTTTTTTEIEHLPRVVQTPQSGHVVYPHILHSPSGHLANLPAPPGTSRSETSSSSHEEHLPSAFGNGRVSGDLHQRLHSKHSQSFNDLDATAANAGGTGKDEEGDAGSKDHHQHHHHKKHHHHHHHSSHSGHHHSSKNDEDGPSTIP